MAEATTNVFALPRPVHLQPAKLSRWSPLLLVIACALPVAGLTIPPMNDLLGHVGRFAIQTGHFGKPLYLFDWKLIGNLGSDVLVQMLAPWFGVLGAVRIILILTQMLASAGILLLSRQLHGRVTPASVLALSLIYAFPFSYGFLNFSLSMALALLAFTLWLRLEEPRHTPIRAALFAPLTLALWCCHTYGWAFLCLLCGARALVKGNRGGERDSLLVPLGRCWPLLFPLLPMLLWRAEGQGAAFDGWFHMAAKLAWLVSALRLEWEWFDKASVAVLVFAIYVGMRSAKLRRNPTMLVATLLCLGVFAAMPEWVFGSYFADMRLAPYILMMALLALGPVEPESSSRRAMTAALAFLGLRLCATGYVYEVHESRLESARAAAAAMPVGARVATLVTQPCPSQWQLPWLAHVGSLALLDRHVFSNDQWAGSTNNPLTVDYPAAGRFASDPGQIVFPVSCAQAGATLDEAMAEIPLRAFTHIWFVGAHPARLPADLSQTALSSGPHDWVYTVGRHAH